MLMTESRRARGWRKTCQRHKTFTGVSCQVVYYHRQLDSSKRNQAMTARSESRTRTEDGQARRQAAMAVLAHSSADEIAGRLQAFAMPAYENLREPENGLVMVRGRIGGDGTPFNLGEATVSRAAVRLATGEVGFGYTLGR